MAARRARIASRVAYWRAVKRELRGAIQLHTGICYAMDRVDAPGRLRARERARFYTLVATLLGASAVTCGGYYWPTGSFEGDWQRRRVVETLLRRRVPIEPRWLAYVDKRCF